MKISYNVLRQYIPDIASPEKVAQDLIMHCAEIESIEYESHQYDNIVYGIIKDIQSHNNADSLSVCMVDIWENENVQIVCGASNLSVWQAVAVAKIWAQVVWHGVWDPIVMKETKIRGVESFWMICASEEIWLKDEFPALWEKEILDISHIASKAWTPLAEVLQKNTITLEIDNKAINHRPDLFSHIWVAREVAAISKKDFHFSFPTQEICQSEKQVPLENNISQYVQRYIACHVTWVKNSESPENIKQVLKSHNITSKWILVDLTNYSLYLYGQPTHCFDADTIVWNIHIRFASPWEQLEALNDKTYQLDENDIVIADDAWVIALWWIIWWKRTAVWENTKNIIIESAHFHHAYVRKTGKRLGIRTDALNVFEKNISLELQEHGVACIIQELKKIFPQAQVQGYTDMNIDQVKQKKVPCNIDQINRLIGSNYTKIEILGILARLGIVYEDNTFVIPFWRTDIEQLADISEEIARIQWYDTIQKTIPTLQTWAIKQDKKYLAKRDLRNFLVARWYYDMYSYAFVNQKLMEKCLWDTANCVSLKNSLSEELSHMRPSIIPLLMQALENNARDYTNLKLFEIEKIYKQEQLNIIEELAWSMVIYNSQEENLYSTAFHELQDSLKKIWIWEFEVKKSKNIPQFLHPWRSAEIIIQGKSVWYIWEIHPKVMKNFSLLGRAACIEIQVDAIIDYTYRDPNIEELSNYQANTFDITFVVEKQKAGSEIQAIIKKCHPFIKNVDLFDIYESDEKIPGKRALSFSVGIQSMDETLDDAFKNTIIKLIIQEVEKAWGILR